MLKILPHFGGAFSFNVDILFYSRSNCLKHVLLGAEFIGVGTVLVDLLQWVLCLPRSHCHHNQGKLYSIYHSSIIGVAVAMSVMEK